MSKVLSDLLREARNRKQPQLKGRQPQGSRLNFLELLPDGNGDTHLPNRILDHLLQFLTPFEQVVYIQLYRLTRGQHRSRCAISDKDLARRANVEFSQIEHITERLEARGLIEIIERALRSTKYEVIAVESSVEN